MRLRFGYIAAILLPASSLSTANITSEYSFITQAYVVCNEEGYATKLELTQKFYSEKQCQATVAGEIRSLYSTEKISDIIDDSISFIFKFTNS